MEPTVTTGSDAGSVVERNRRAWNHLARLHSTASDPWDMPATAAEMRTWVDELGCLPWRDLRSVLVLCGAGGQQAPTFARLGLAVTVVDLAEEQLAIDRRVAERYDVGLETVVADVHDLSVLAGRQFDLVYQPASTCYLPDPRACYRNVARLLAPGGLYLSEHWNPAQIQLGAARRWDGAAYRIIHPSGAGEALNVSHPALGPGPDAVYFAHRMKDLVGGICEAGFVIERFGERDDADPAAEPDSPGHLGRYLPSFFQILARRTAPPAPRPAEAGAAAAKSTALVRPPNDPGRAAAAFRRGGYAVVRDVLDVERLLPRLTREALVQRGQEYRTRSRHYGIGHDGSYVAGGMAFTSSVPGPVLQSLHDSPELRALVGAVTGDDALRRSGTLSYMYYGPGSYIDLHTDVPSCTVTVLTTVIGRTPPLVAYPRLFDRPPAQLLAVARRYHGRPPGGVRLALPPGGLLLIDGRRLPHRRPLVPPDAGRYGIAALCFV